MRSDPRPTPDATTRVASRIERGTGRRHLQPVARDGAVPDQDVGQSILSLPHRFEPQRAGRTRASYILDVIDHPTHTLRVERGSCLVTAGRTSRPDAVLRMHADTWLGVLDGERTGIAAFLAGDLQVRGDLNAALKLDTMFRPAPRAPQRAAFLRTDIRGVQVESMVAGTGRPVVLLHGLAANKASLLPTFAALSEHHQVHAVDLPGFGKSDKPLPRGRTYSMGWMADIVRGYLVRNGLHDAVIVGNSMGGRIAIETALRHPHAVGGIALLGPAVAFDEWQRLGPWLARTGFQWGALLTMPMRRAWIERGIRDVLLHDPAAIADDTIDAAVDDTMLALRDPRYRMATAACARHLIRERAEGRHGFWPRLAELSVPSLWLWGSNDHMVSADYAERVRLTVPTSAVEVWDDVGHLPQFESPARTHASIDQFITELAARRDDAA